MMISLLKFEFFLLFPGPKDLLNLGREAMNNDPFSDLALASDISDSTEDVAILCE